MPEIVCTLCGKKKWISPSDWGANKTKTFFCTREHARAYRKICVKKNGNICNSGQVQA